MGGSWRADEDGVAERLEEELKDFVLSGVGSDIYLNNLLSLAIAYLNKGYFLESGGYLDQPYFFMSYVVPWVEQGIQERVKAKAQYQPLEV